MIPLERKNKILELLKSKSMTVNQLASCIYVSPMTVRRDIKQLVDDNLVRIVKGNIELISYSEKPNNYFSYEMRMNIRTVEKKEVAKRASELIENGDTIYIDASSSALYIVDYIKSEQNLTVITNSVKAAVKLAEKNIYHILIGGKYHKFEKALLGLIAEKNTISNKIDKMFFSSEGIVPGDFIYDSNDSMTAIRQKFLSISQKKYFLCVAHKIGKKSLFKVCVADDDIEIIYSNPADVATEGGDTR